MKGLLSAAGKTPQVPQGQRLYGTRNSTGAVNANDLSFPSSVNKADMLNPHDL
jgi:hypothetical protein